MARDLGYVLPGVGVWLGEEGDQHLVNAAALVVYELAECNLSRRERCVGFPLDKLLRQTESLRPGKPYDTDTASTRRGRDRNNGVFGIDGSQFCPGISVQGRAAYEPPNGAASMSPRARALTGSVLPAPKRCAWFRLVPASERFIVDCCGDKFTIDSEMSGSKATWRTLSACARSPGRSESLWDSFVVFNEPPIRPAKC